MLETLCLKVFAYLMEILALCRHVVLYLTDGLRTALLCGHEIAGRIYGDFIKFSYECSGQRIDNGDLFHLISEELYPDRIFAIAYADIDCITANPEGSPLELSLCPAIESVHKLIQQPGHTPLLSPFNLYCLRMEILRISDTIKT